jgi:hypothetical protein
LASTYGMQGGHDVRDELQRSIVHLVVHAG